MIFTWSTEPDVGERYQYLSIRTALTVAKRLRTIKKNVVIENIFPKGEAFGRRSDRRSCSADTDARGDERRDKNYRG